MASLEGISLTYAAHDVPRTLISSVQGFSRPNRRTIRSLQQLLDTVKSRRLTVFPGPLLREDQFLGEGVSYKVFRCTERQKQLVVAVKQVKLPSTIQNDESFDRQVATVLRDIEVMSHEPLANHPNILPLFGCGWNFGGNQAIPFLVTEYATDGTMRDYLAEYNASVQDKLLCCMDVCRGLYALHKCGIVHGDLKLENILVTQRLESAGATTHGRTQGIKAVLSDFGHSLLIYEDEEEREEQRYGGTLAYNAPELCDRRYDRTRSVNFRKCDMWAFGLLCWEILDNGLPFFRSARVQELVTLSRSKSGSPSSSSDDATGSSSSTMIEKLMLVSDQLMYAAVDLVNTNAELGLSQVEKDKLAILFKLTLNPDPGQRVADLPGLPIWRRTKEQIHNFKLNVRGTVTWTFDIFRPEEMVKMPFAVKRQIFDDCHRIGSEPGSSISAGHAALHVAIAHVVGYCVEKSREKGLEWLTTSIEKGLTLAKSVEPLFRCRIYSQRPIDSITSFSESKEIDDKHVNHYSQSLRQTYKDLVQHHLESTFDLSIAYFPQLRELQKQIELDTQSPYPLAHHATYLSSRTNFHWTRYMTSEEINRPDSAGETALFRACQLGDTKAVQTLLLKGASPTVAAYDGCTPLHWLFMFQPQEMEDIACVLGAGALSQTLLFSESIRYIDNQLPTRLFGTPLAFAVAAACEPAVEILLSFGADPYPAHLISPISIRKPLLSIRTPLHVAYSLQLPSILKRLLAACDHPCRLRRPIPPVEIIGIIAESCCFETDLIHGENAPAVLNNLLCHVVELCGREDLEYMPATVWRLVKPAIQLGDVGFARELRERLRRANVPMISSYDNKLAVVNHMVETCTSVACRNAFSSNTSIELLEFTLTFLADMGFPANFNQFPSPVWKAIEVHRIEVFDWLLKEEFNVNTRDQHGQTVLHHMLMHGFSAAYPISKLLALGADPNVHDISGNTPLHLAIRERRLKDVRSLLEHGANPATQEQGLEWCYPLHIAVSTEQGDIVTLLLKYKADIHVTDSFGRSPLYLAISIGSVDVVKLLVGAGADPCAFHSAYDTEGLNYFYSACLMCQPEVLKFLLETRPFDDRQYQPTGKRALNIAMQCFIASSSKRKEALRCFSLLLTAGARLDVQDIDNMTPITTLIDKIDAEGPGEGTFDIYKLMVDSGADVDAISPRSGKSMLHVAINRSNIELQKLVIQLGASVNTPTSGTALSPLHLCAMVGGKNHRSNNIRGHADVIHRLSSFGASLDSRDSLGQTPLELAVRLDQGNSVRILLELYLSAGRIRPQPSRNDPSTSLISESDHEAAEGVSNQFRHFQMSLKNKWKDIARTERVANDDLQTDLDNQAHHAVLKAWHDSVSMKRWASVAAFLAVGAHGSLNGLRWPNGIGLLKHALDEEHFEVLQMYMGSSDGSIPPDTILGGNWNKLRTARSRKLTKTLGLGYTIRIKHLAKRGGYDPQLTIDYIEERGYIESQAEFGLLELAAPFEGRKAQVVERSVLSGEMSDSEDDDDSAEYQVVQRNLTSLLGPKWDQLVRFKARPKVPPGPPEALRLESSHSYASTNPYPEQVFELPISRGLDSILARTKRRLLTGPISA